MALLIDKGLLEGPSYTKQILLGVVLATPSIPAGMTYGFPAIALPQLDYDIEHSSWFVSVAALAIPGGSLLNGAVLDLLGRRAGLLIINIFSFLGWFLIALVKSHYASLLTGRILTGFAIGLSTLPSAVYAAECLAANDSRLRTSLPLWNSFATALGILLVYVLGSLFEFSTVAAIAALICFVSLALVAFFIPESPKWLELQGRDGDAEFSRKSLMLVRQDNEESTKIYHTKMSLINTIDALMKPEPMRPMFVMTVFMFLQQFSGVNVNISYMTDVLKNAGVENINLNGATVVQGMVILFVSLAACFIVPITGIRVMALVSAVGISVTMLGIGTFLTWRKHFISKDEYYHYSWIPLTLLIINALTSTIGFFILPWAILGQIFPQNIKGICGGIVTFFAYIFLFIAFETYLPLQFHLGEHIFYLYGAVAFCGGFFLKAYLPETNGKSTKEIETQMEHYNFYCGICASKSGLNLRNMR